MTPPLWSASDLTDATGGTLAVPFDATGVSIDTRTLSPGDLFVALQGENGDGHRFVADALAKGAAGAMVHQDVPGASHLLRVDDTLAALTLLGAYARARFAGRVVAVTGSVGKTTTKEMLRCALSALGPTHAAVASYNNHWGVPLTLARLPPMHRPTARSRARADADGPARTRRVLSSPGRSGRQGGKDRCRCLQRLEHIAQARDS